MYILTNQRQTVLYVGMTNDLTRRIWEHKQKEIDGFTKRYNIDKLIYFEEYNRPNKAIEREKQIKGWRRSKKDELINQLNPDWEDLYQQII